jgi:hypothetical protein
MTDDQTTDRVPANADILHKVADYQRAKESRARWEAEEKRLKEEILETLGYDPEDPKPTPMEIIDPITGVVMFSVKVGTWRGMNFGYLKETYPDVYAECESSKKTLGIKLP